MIKYLEAVATEMSSQHHVCQFTTLMIKHQKTFSQPLKWYEKPHGVPDNPELDVDVIQIE
jgi:hypothetical protein